jgi:hypothetical protein
MTLVISKGLTLDNGTRAAAIAGVSPTLDYRFAREKREIETVSLTDKLTFTGGNQGTFVGSDGFIQPATTNVPRFDHDPLSRQSLGLLSEGSKENLLLRSEEFDNASWVKPSATISPNTTTAPDGTSSADLIVVNNAASLGGIQQAVTKAAAPITYTFSIFAKVKEHQFVRLLIRDTVAAGSRGDLTFNLATGATSGSFVGGGFTNLASSQKPYSNGWIRLSLTVTTASETSIRPEAYSSTTGDGTSGLFLWGAQLEAASSASTYIPTTSAAVTRTADSAVIDGTGVITGTYTLVEKPAGCAVVSGTNINLQPGFTAERVMVFPAALDAGQITAIRGAM